MFPVLFRRFPEKTHHVSHAFWISLGVTWAGGFGIGYGSVAQGRWHYRTSQGQGLIRSGSVVARPFPGYPVRLREEVFHRS